MADALWTTARGASARYGLISLQRSGVDGLHPRRVDEQVAHEAMGTGSGVHDGKIAKRISCGITGATHPATQIVINGRQR